MRENSPAWGRTSASRLFRSVIEGMKHNFYFPRFLKSLNASLYHIPLNSVAWWMPRPYVVTIHDMSSLLFPSQRDFRYTVHQERYRRGVIRAARVIAVSHATRRDLQGVLRISDERLSTIYSAPDPAFTTVRRRPGAAAADPGSLFDQLPIHPLRGNYARPQECPAPGGSVRRTAA